MTTFLPPIVLQITTALFGAVCVGLLVYLMPTRWPAPLLRMTARDVELAAEAAQVFGRDAVPPSTMIVAYLVSGILAFLCLWPLAGLWLALVAAIPAALFIPKTLIRMMLKRRWDKIEAQLPYAVDQIVSAVRSGKPLATAVGAVAESGPMPAAREFERIAREQKLGVGLIEALGRHALVVPSLHFKMVDAALGLFARQGGDIAEPLTEMSKSFKEIWKLDQKVTTSSSQARMNFRVINGGALFMVILIFLGQPELIDKVFGSMIGIAVFAAGLLLYATGFFWMRAMMKVSV
jgi:tight adherence protein B